MSNGRFLNYLAALALFTGSLQSAAAQSVNVPEREDKENTAVPFDAKQQRVSHLVRIGNGFYLQRSQDGFGVRAHGVVERTASVSKFYPLPQSSVQEYRRLRGNEINAHRSPPIRTAKDYERQEVIGPYQIEGSLLWFGNNYYDGEGATGVGAFGYFDTKTRHYLLFSPPEVAHWESSALLVEPDVVWVGLDHFGEDISTSPGGLVRWDRNDHRIRHYQLEFVVDRIQRDKTDASMLRLTTQGGYALFRDGEVQRFHVQKGSDGKEAVVGITRFPPPPTKQ